MIKNILVFIGIIAVGKHISKKLVKGMKTLAKDIRVLDGLKEGEIVNTYSKDNDGFETLMTYQKVDGKVKKLMN